jgi:hypothetical protein
MNQHLEQSLITNYPDIFKDMYGDEKQTCMAFGIETGNGWYNLIESACFNIQETVDLVNHIHPEIGFVVTAAQIKEKFGGLRFYIDYHGNKTDKELQWAYAQIESAIRFAEKKSYYICDNCGDYMKYEKSEGWHYPKCEACYEERMRELDEKAHLRRLPLSDTSDTIDGGAKP